MNSSLFQNRFFAHNQIGTLTPPALSQHRSKPSLYFRQQNPPREYPYHHYTDQRDRSPIKKQIQGVIMRNDSLKHLAIKRRNSNFTENQKYPYYNTQKTIKVQQSDIKPSAMYETSCTMKQIENNDPTQKSSFYPNKKRNMQTRISLFAEKKVDGDWFDVIKPIGKGKYGKVYLVKDKQNGFIMALKAIQKKKLVESNLLEQFIRQLKIQFYLDHPGIVKLYGFFDDPENFYLLMQLGCDGQLYDKISDQRLLSEQSTSFVARTMLQVVDYMHSQKVLHRDIKPENIVIILGHLKICDFGWAVYNNTEMRSTFCGTPLYFSPELLSGQQYDEKVDLWAIGVMIFQLVMGVSPFNLKQPQDLRKIVTHDVQFPKGMRTSLEFKSFINKILQKNPQKRPTSKQLLQSSYIRKFKDLQVCEQLCRVQKQIQKQRSKSRGAKSSGKTKFQEKPSKFY